MKKNSLGKSLIRDHKKKRTVVNKEGFRHTSDLPDGFDWARLNLHSVTEQSTVDDFLDQVKLAENEYNKEFSNIEILSPEEALDILTEEEREKRKEAQESSNRLLSIPRRPVWHNLTKEELDGRERENFLNWRRTLAALREEKKLDITPYEKNLEVWRQLWRVIEKSDLILQIIDARNPLLFRCDDLELYVKEIDKRKKNILLLNKADFLSEMQRKMWAQYFDSIGVKVIFFSALQQMKDKDTASPSVASNDESDEEEESSDDEEEDEILEAPVSDHLDGKVINNGMEVDSVESTETCTENPATDEGLNSVKILSRLELASYLKSLVDPELRHNGIATIGLVGYPNVGKSSTINAVLLNKKVKVSATPGKTKHFQTIMVEPDLCFCDCPGLVFPKFVATKADMVVNGILPIDQLTEFKAPVTLVTQLISRRMLETTYSIIIPKSEEKDPSIPPSAEEFLNAYGYMRGFMTHRGLPDNARSSRYILKDFVNGKLLYCFPPPDANADVFKEHSIFTVPEGRTKAFIPTQKCYSRGEEIDKNFFKKAFSKAHVKGVKGIVGYSNVSSNSSSNASETTGKPWRKHRNKNRKEKLRRVYAYADQ